MSGRKRKGGEIKTKYVFGEHCCNKTRRLIQGKSQGAKDNEKIFSYSSLSKYYSLSLKKLQENTGKSLFMTKQHPNCFMQISPVKAASFSAHKSKLLDPKQAHLE